ncbi:MAG TPA: hypothetical protein VJS66_03840 [Burkholderiales bacterium]|nr:hypothetical protein [Burkholderiales bacterium]
MQNDGVVIRGYRSIHHRSLFVVVSDGGKLLSISERNQSSGTEARRANGGTKQSD